MKALTLTTLFLLVSQLSFSQDITREEITNFITSEKIRKQITFTFIKNNNNDQLVVKAKNLTNSTAQSCAWEVDLTRDEAVQFAIKLNNASENCNTDLDADWLTSNTTVKCKKNKLKIKIKNAICTSGHQISYFQKDCNKKLTFIIEKLQGGEIAHDLISYLSPENNFIVEKIKYTEVSKQGGLLRCSTLPLIREN